MKKIPPLPQKTAEQMLENIFLLCDKTPNSVPLKTLIAYSNYRQERFSMQRTVIIVLLVLFLLLPFLFITTDLSVTRMETGPNENPTYRIRLSSSLPVRQISARVNGVTQPIYEEGNNIYTLRPGRNGVLTVEATLFNLQKTKETVSVAGVDFGNPRLYRVRRTGDSVFLFFRDTVSGIDFSAITVTDHQGHSVPFQYDTDTDCLTLAHTNENLNIEVPDNRGNVLKLVLTPPQ